MASSTASPRRMRLRSGDLILDVEGLGLFLGVWGGSCSFSWERIGWRRFEGEDVWAKALYLRCWARA